MEGNQKETNQRESLSSLFDKGFSIYSCLDTIGSSTSSEAYQSDVKKAINIFEDVTKTVSSVGLFSNNEDIDEVSTADIKYLLLPALLGSLSLRHLTECRADVLGIAEIYFRDFLIRLKDYGMTDIEVPPIYSETQEDTKTNVEISTGLPDLLQMNRSRDEKIKKYRQMKELDSRIAELRKAIQSSNVDDEVKRDYYLALIRRWIQQSLEDLAAIKMEMPLLEKVLRMRASGDHNDVGLKRPKKTPLKPFIITRNQAQKQIYGLGYPSIPTMTVDEFYEQKVKDGTFKIPDMSLQAQMNGDLDRVAQREQDSIDREAEEETDDPIALRRNHEWDDWKDDHRRGWGNRKNKG